MKRALSIRKTFCHRRLCAALAACFGATAALAAPTGAQIAAGAASFAQNGNALTVTNSNGTIINWQSFSIAANESVRFAQAANSSVLNRVVGNIRSDILGQLTSDGRVFLINPAGIMIGAGAQINVGSFVASTLQMSDADFLAGRYRFFTDPVLGAGSLRNEGTIRSAQGGRVYLVAPQADNAGSIVTAGGETILAAGRTVEIGDTASPGVRVEITGSGSESATNLGSIVADAGRIGLVGALVKNSGTLSATSAVEQGGKIFLRATGNIEQSASGRIQADGTRGGSVSLDADNITRVDGQISATGSSGAGGNIHLLGDKVGVIDQASVDASGTSAGGSILVGGDYQGANADIKNASVTYFGGDATLKADATDTGNGGKVVVWADDTTRAFGNIFARGGTHGGDGGLVETSGHRHLDFRGKVNTSAAKGKNGTLLLDPSDITISFDSDFLDGASYSTIDGNYFYGGGKDSIINWNTLVGVLNSGTSLTITTQSAQGGNGDITFNSGNYSYSSTNTLAFWAQRDILLNGASLINSNSGAIKMIAGWNEAIDDQAAPIPGTGAISLTQGAKIATAGILDIRAGSDITLDASGAGGSVTLTSGGASQWIEAGGKVRVLAGYGGDATIYL